MALNKVILMGRLTAAPELKRTASGISVTSFSLAVDRRFSKEGEERKADFPTVVAYRQTAEFICRYFAKGSQILLCGELQTRSWKDAQGNNRYTTEVVATEVSFCGAKTESTACHIPNDQSASQVKFKAPKEELNFEAISIDDDLPF